MPCCIGGAEKGGINRRDTEDTEEKPRKIRDFYFAFRTLHFAFRKSLDFSFFFSVSSVPPGESSCRSDAALFKMKSQICCAVSYIVAFALHPIDVATLFI
jgi:hypothetical protein